MEREKAKKIAESLRGITVGDWEGIKKAIDEMVYHSTIERVPELEKHIYHYVIREEEKRIPSNPNDGFK